MDDVKDLLNKMEDLRCVIDRNIRILQSMLPEESGAKGKKDAYDPDDYLHHYIGYDDKKNTASIQDRLPY